MDLSHPIVTALAWSLSCVSTGLTLLILGMQAYVLYKKIKTKSWEKGEK